MRLTLGRWLGLGLTLLTLHAAACAPPDQGAAGRGGTLVVGMADPAAVAWLDDGHGRHGAALAGAPEQVAAGPGGSVVALTAGAAGRRYAMVVYQPRPEGPRALRPRRRSQVRAARCSCSTSSAGRQASTPGPCRADESLRSLVVEPAGNLDAEGPPPAAFAFVGLAGTRDGSENGAGRVVAAEASSASTSTSAVRRRACCGSWTRAQACVSQTSEYQAPRSV